MTRFRLIKFGKEGFDQLIKMLASKDPELRVFARDRFIMAAGYAGAERILWGLMIEANRPRRRIKTRLRILEVVQAIGPPMGRAFFELGPLLEHPSPQLRQKAVELMIGMPNQDAAQRRDEILPTERQSEGDKPSTD